MSKSVKCTLKFIRTDEFATIGKSEDITLEGVGLENQFSFGLYNNSRQMQVIYKSIFQFEGKPFIILQVSCGFEIEAKDFNEIATPKDGVITFSQAFMLSLSTITVGTARGILHSKLENTEFSNYYMLPIINIEEIVSGDVVFQLEATQNT